MIDGWHFNPEYVKIRQGLKHVKTMKEVHSFNDDVITSAFTMPDVSNNVLKLFNFLQDNQNLITTSGGMEHYMTGLDRSKLVPLAKGYNIDLFKWMFAVNRFERGLLNRHNQKDK